jgi:nucleoside-diphosphate-sugar epimerase
MLTMKLLVLGGTHHVGRSVVEEALARGDQVTTLTRGLSGPSASGALGLHGDRTDPAALRAVLGDATWDAVIDTWSGAPAVVGDAATLLKDRAGHYGYVSSRSVYRWPTPPGADESAPVVDGDPADTGSEDYAAAKRGGELAAVEAFGNRALLARAGLILGPYEIVGRMPWWLGRIDRGGEVLAPGPPERPLQLIDCRDLAGWMLSAAGRGLGGTFNTVSQPGHATMASLLEAAIRVTGSGARLIWVSPEVIEAVGIEAWTELPIWLPPTGEAAGMHAGDVTAAYAAGLTCRPVEETIAATWQWIQAEGYPPARPGRPGPGLDPEKERQVLGSLPA